jgi:hypothetical protein
MSNNNSEPLERPIKQPRMIITGGGGPNPSVCIFGLIIFLMMFLMIVLGQ